MEDPNCSTCWSDDTRDQLLRRRGKFTRVHLLVGYANQDGPLHYRGCFVERTDIR